MQGKFYQEEVGNVSSVINHMALERSLDYFKILVVGGLSFRNNCFF